MKTLSCFLCVALIWCSTAYADTFGLSPVSTVAEAPEPQTFGLSPVGVTSRSRSNTHFAFDAVNDGKLMQQVCTDVNGDGICDQTGVLLRSRSRTVTRTRGWQPVTQSPTFGLRLEKPVTTVDVDLATGMVQTNGTVLKQRTRWETATEMREVTVMKPVTEMREVTVQRPVTEWVEVQAAPVVVNKVCHKCGQVHVRSNVSVDMWLDDAGEEKSVEYTRTGRAVRYSKESGRYHNARNGRAVFFDGQGWWPGKLFGVKAPGTRLGY